jgi:enoyl-CoA hydratase/carnithine racemase
VHHVVASVWGELGRDPEVRALVLTSADRAFNARGDVPGLNSRRRPRHVSGWTQGGDAKRTLNLVRCGPRAEAAIRCRGG